MSFFQGATNILITGGSFITTACEHNRHETHVDSSNTYNLDDNSKRISGHNPRSRFLHDVKGDDDMPRAPPISAEDLTGPPSHYPQFMPSQNSSAGNSFNGKNIQIDDDYGGSHHTNQRHRVARKPIHEEEEEEGDLQSNFINRYVRLYTELEEQQRHLHVGLDKLNGTVTQVEELKKSLAIKRSQLEAKDREANEKLKRMVADQQEAEQKKGASIQIQTKPAEQDHYVEQRRAVVADEEANRELKCMVADQQEAEQKKVASIRIQAELAGLDRYIGQRRAVATADLADTEPAVFDAQAAVSNIKRQHLQEVRVMANPPEAVRLAMQSVCIILGYKVDSWRSVQSIIRRDDFIQRIVNFDTTTQMTKSLRDTIRKDFISRPSYNFEVVQRASKACGPLVKWVLAQVHFSEILDRVEPSRKEIQDLEQDYIEQHRAVVTAHQEANGELKCMLAELARLDRYIEQCRAVVVTDLADAEPAVLDAQAAVCNIKRQHLQEVRVTANPPEAVILAMESVCIILGHKVDSWRSVQSIIRRDDFIQRIVNFDTTTQMTKSLRDTIRKNFISRPSYNFEIVQRANKACGPIVKWVLAQVHFSELLDKVEPLRKEIQDLEQQAETIKKQASAMVPMVT